MKYNKDREVINNLLAAGTKEYLKNRLYTDSFKIDVDAIIKPKFSLKLILNKLLISSIRTVIQLTVSAIVIILIVFLTGYAVQNYFYDFDKIVIKLFHDAGPVYLFAVNIIIFFMLSYYRKLKLLKEHIFLC